MSPNVSAVISESQAAVEQVLRYFTSVQTSQSAAVCWQVHRRRPRDEKYWLKGLSECDYYICRGEVNTVREFVPDLSESRNTTMQRYKLQIVMYVLEVLKVAIRFKKKQKLTLIIRNPIQVKLSYLYGTFTARKVVFISYHIVISTFTQVLFLILGWLFLYQSNIFHLYFDSSIKTSGYFFQHLYVAYNNPHTLHNLHVAYHTVHFTYNTSFIEKLKDVFVTLCSCWLLPGAPSDSPSTQTRLGNMKRYPQL